MSDCKCKSPCNPCNKNCPDDKITVIRDTIDASEPLEVELLDADECSGPCWGCCSSKCNDNCWINIQSTNECLTVDTSECGVVKLTSHCPPIVTAWDNVTVEVEECWQENCSLNYIVSAECEDEKVKACSWDTTPGYLYNKLQEWPWILIDPVGCDWSNSKVKISIDEDILPDCPEPPDLIIDNQSNIINVSQSWDHNHRVLITDKDAKPYYAKLVLRTNHIWSEATWQVWVWEKYLWEKSSVSFLPVRQQGHVIWVENSLRKNLKFFQWTDVDPWLWWIQITKKWLYQVWFSWSAEFSYWVHAFRVQMYRIPKSDFNKRNTIVESRYSWPLGYEPWQPVMGWAWNIRYVSGVSWGWEEWEAQATYSEYHIDYPLIWEKTEVEWQHWIGYSASLWAVMDRVAVTWNSIVELDVWDVVCMWLKMSTSITHSWSMMANIPAAFLTWHLALLGIEEWQSDNWWEAGFSYYANLIHSLYD